MAWNNSRLMTRNSVGVYMTVFYCTLRTKESMIVKCLLASVRGWLVEAPDKTLSTRKVDFRVPVSNNHGKSNRSGDQVKTSPRHASGVEMKNGLVKWFHEKNRSIFFSSRTSLFRISFLPLTLPRFEEKEKHPTNFQSEYFKLPTPKSYQLNRSSTICFTEIKKPA